MKAAMKRAAAARFVNAFITATRMATFSAAAPYRP
jgi:hypothetical protein